VHKNQRCINKGHSNLLQVIDLCIIGGGKMGSALARRLSSALPAQRSLAVVDASPAVREELSKTGIEVSESPLEAKTYLIAVKPDKVKEVLNGLAERRPRIISIAAGVTVSQLANWSGSGQVVRTMPNIAAVVGASMTAICSSPEQQDLVDEAVELFSLVGATLVIEEAYLDAVSAISGSGPAYFFLMLEAMQEAGIALGLSAGTALDLAIQTAAGAAAMARDLDGDPRLLRLSVTSPGGMTAKAVAEFERLGFRHAVHSAIDQAAKASRELSHKAESD
jgi:pyrroline-5-carboxylate reductase